MEKEISSSQGHTDIPKNLECPICGDVFDKAVSLKPCRHTFCSICIRNHWVITSRPGVHHQSKRECPLCRTAVANDVNRSLEINREIQEAAKLFKRSSLPLRSSAKPGSLENEAPILKRMQSRNYSAMQKSGKKELQSVCKEFNISSSGNEQELVDRLRSFECMWNAELDTIDTPLTPSQLVAKFKKRERLQREEISRAIITGTINHSKYMKRLTSSLLDKENKRNNKMVGSTTSGNKLFDAKFNSNFDLLVAEGRSRMKRSSYWSSSSKKVERHAYDDDGIHDIPERSGSGDNESRVEISPIAGARISLEAKCSDETVTNDSLNVVRHSQKNAIGLNNPYTAERKRRFQEASYRSMTQSNHFPQKPTEERTTSTQLNQSQSLKKAKAIHNPYLKRNR